MCLRQLLLISVNIIETHWTHLSAKSQLQSQTLGVNTPLAIANAFTVSLYRGQILAMILLQGYIECNLRAAFQEIVLRIQDAPKWSPTVLDCKVCGMCAHVCYIAFVVDWCKVKSNLKAMILWWVLYCSFQVLHIIDDTTDIIYNVAAEAAGGIVSSRSNFITNLKGF